MTKQDKPTGTVSTVLLIFAFILFFVFGYLTSELWHALNPSSAVVSILSNAGYINMGVDKKTPFYYSNVDGNCFVNATMR